MDQSLLVCKGLYKTFGAKQILVNLSIQLGAMTIAVVGSNGAGKSTLLSILSGAEHPDSGSVLINSEDLLLHPVAAKKQLAYVPDKATVYPFMTGEEYLKFIHLAKKESNTTQSKFLIKCFGLEQHLKQRFSNMSLGTQRKFMLSAAFIGNPKVIIMDEPSNGLDQSSRNILIELLLKGNESRLTIFSTHDKLFIEQTNAKTVLLEHGLLLEYTADKITDSYCYEPAS